MQLTSFSVSYSTLFHFKNMEKDGFRLETVGTDILAYLTLSSVVIFLNCVMFLLMTVSDWLYCYNSCELSVKFHQFFSVKFRRVLIMHCHAKHRTYYSSYIQTSHL